LYERLHNKVLSSRDRCSKNCPAPYIPRYPPVIRVAAAASRRRRRRRRRFFGRRAQEGEEPGFAQGDLQQSDPDPYGVSLYYGDSTEVTSLELDLGGGEESSSRRRMQYVTEEPDASVQVRKTAYRPRSWTDCRPLSLCSHRNARADLHLLGQPDTFSRCRRVSDRYSISSVPA
jgi:hypothetical protein